MIPCISNFLNRIVWLMKSMHFEKKSLVLPINDLITDKSFYYFCNITYHRYWTMIIFVIDVPAILTDSLQIEVILTFFQSWLNKHRIQDIYLWHLQWHENIWDWFCQWNEDNISIFHFLFYLFQIHSYRVNQSVILFFHGALLQSKTYRYK